MHNIKLIAILLLSMFFSGYAFAQDIDSTQQSNSDSTAAAQNSLIFGNGGAPSIQPGGTTHTAPCVIGRGISFGIVGGGAGVNWGKLEKSCLTRLEAEWLIKLVSMPNSVGKRAAIIHACKNNKSLRETLVVIGACIIKK